MPHGLLSHHLGEVSRAERLANIVRLGDFDRMRTEHHLLRHPSDLSPGPRLPSSRNETSESTLTLTLSCASLGICTRYPGTQVGDSNSEILWVTMCPHSSF